MHHLVCFLLIIGSLVAGSTAGMIGSVLLFVILHMVAMVIGKREPHIDNIIASRNNIRARTKNVLVEDGNKFMT